MAENHLRRSRRAQVAPPSPRIELGSKVRKIISHLDQMKLEFHQLRSQIKDGLLETQDVLASLAIPLMKLVGLKTVEMAKEGRFSTIVVEPDSIYHPRENVSGSSVKSSAMGGGDQNHHSYNLQEENITSKAGREGKELVDKQRMQLLRLVYLLKKVEFHVNSCEDDMLQTLADNKDSLRNTLEKAISFMATHHSHDNEENFSVIVHLLRMIFRKVNGMLCSVENGVEKLMQELGKEMCNPMTEYVNGMKNDMEKGVCARLLATVEEVEEAVKFERLELEEARRRERVAEERKAEALIRLRDTEERVKKVSKCLELVSKAHKRSAEPFASHMLMGMEEEKKKKRKCGRRGAAESPMGPRELVWVEPGSNHHRYPTRSSIAMSQSQSQSHRLASSSWQLSPQTPGPDIRIPLGPSPSVRSKFAA